jgi:hypothetical protein
VSGSTAICTKFIDDTNESSVLAGRFGQFNGEFFAGLVASNGSGSSVRIRIEGIFVPTGSRMCMTNLVTILYPGYTSLVVTNFGSITGWFLSDKELADFRAGKVAW